MDAAREQRKENRIMDIVEGRRDTVAGRSQGKFKFKNNKLSRWKQVRNEKCVSLEAYRTTVLL